MRRGVSMTTFIFIALLIVVIPNEVRNLFLAEPQVSSRFLVAPLLGMTNLIEPEPSSLIERDRAGQTRASLTTYSASMANRAKQPSAVDEYNFMAMASARKDVAASIE